VAAVRGWLNLDYRCPRKREEPSNFPSFERDYKSRAAASAAARVSMISS
jgi:hypothetical protein